MDDVLSDILTRLRLRGCVYFERDFHAPWALSMADTGFAQFHVVTRGTGIVEAAGGRRDVAAGDILFFPHGQAHVLADAPGRSPADGPQFMASLATGAPMFATGRQAMRMICGHFAYRWDVPHPLVAELPEMIHLCNCDDPFSPATGPVLTLILQELDRREPGHTVLVERLAEALLIQILRAHFANGRREAGFFAGLADPRLSRAIALVHRDYSAALSVADMAASAAMSRSAFAERFSAVIRMSPAEYLTRWRMIVARDMLDGTDDPVAAIADAVGYGSDIAFTRAYRRQFGETPAATRRA